MSHRIKYILLCIKFYSQFCFRLDTDFRKFDKPILFMFTLRFVLGR